jgi:hypothetical protein
MTDAEAMAGVAIVCGFLKLRMVSGCFLVDEQERLFAIVRNAHYTLWMLRQWAGWRHRPPWHVLEYMIRHGNESAGPQEEVIHGHLDDQIRLLVDLVGLKLDGDRLLARDGREIMLVSDAWQAIEALEDMTSWAPMPGGRDSF